MACTILIHHKDWSRECSYTSNRYIEKIGIGAEFVLTEVLFCTNSETFNNNGWRNIRICKLIQEDLLSCTNTNWICSKAYIKRNPLNRFFRLTQSLWRNNVSDITFIISCKGFILETIRDQCPCTEVGVGVSD